jgi:hypothetical protein
MTAITADLEQPLSLLGSKFTLKFVLSLEALTSILATKGAEWRDTGRPRLRSEGLSGDQGSAPASRRLSAAARHDTRLCPTP